jgi:uncharacterized protein YggU (UPF0235/DUF167 family)
MYIRVIAKTRSKRPGVTHLTGDTYEVAVAALPIKGEANSAVIESLAKYFNLKKNQIRLASGFTSVNKTFELLD